VCVCVCVDIRALDTGHGSVVSLCGDVIKKDSCEESLVNNPHATCCCVAMKHKRVKETKS